jgi:hypothetical protein
MLDKLKLFNKDKDRSKSSKRTSSSSGFSSARSDSSLSLNNDPNTASLNGNKNKKIDASGGKATSTKTSKLLSSKGIKETPAALPSAIKTQSKSDKKDKSSQDVSKLQQQKVPIVKFQQQVTQIQSKQQQQQQQVPMVRKIEIKTNLPMQKAHQQQQQQQQLQLQLQQQQQVTTSIPKPMAAIKGTSKMQVDVKRDENFEMMKSEQKMQIVNPLHSISSSPQHLLIKNNNIHASSQSIHSTSTNNHSNSSESSVIYRPDGGSEFYHSNMPLHHRGNPIPNRKVDHFNEHGIVMSNGMQQPPQHQHHKFNTIPSKLNGTVNATITTTTTIGNNQATIFENGKHQQQQQAATASPLRSIMRNYNNNNNNHHVTLPTRGTRGGQNLVNGYYDEHHNQGYCSDGDALRSKTPIRYTDIENGYLSEGGGVTNPAFMGLFMRNRPQMPTTIAEER